MWESYASKVSCTHENIIKRQDESHMAYGICVLYVARIWHQCDQDICESHMAAMRIGVAKVR